MDEQTEAALQEWARLFNECRYFEAHEVVEERWLVEAEPRKSFLKGLIHASVALCHYQRGNGHGARVKYASAARYLSPYSPRFLNVDVADLLTQMEVLLQPLLSRAPGSPPPPPQAPWPRVSLHSEER